MTPMCVDTILVIDYWLIVWSLIDYLNRRVRSGEWTTVRNVAVWDEMSSVWPRSVPHSTVTPAMLPRQPQGHVVQSVSQVRTDYWHIY